MLVTFIFFFWHCQCIAYALEIVIYFTVILKQNKVEWKTNPLVTTDTSILLTKCSIKLQFWSEVDSNTCQRNGGNVFLPSFSKACLAKGKQRGHNSRIFISLPLYQPQHLSPHFNRWHFKKLSDTFYHIFLCLPVAWKLVKWFQEIDYSHIAHQFIDQGISELLFNATLNDNFCCCCCYCYI